MSLNFSMWLCNKCSRLDITWKSARAHKFAVLDNGPTWENFSRYGDDEHKIFSMREVRDGEDEFYRTYLDDCDDM